MLSKKETPLGKNPTVDTKPKKGEEDMKYTDKKSDKPIDKWIDEAKQDGNIGGG